MQQEMRYVFEVWQEGSFSKAAEKLYLTQPALSIAIQKIEKGVGMPLFDRSQRPLTLTPAGEAYIRTVQQTVYLEQELEQELGDIRDLKRGKIRMGGSHYLNAYILPEILSGFSRKYPGIQLELLESSSAVLAEMLDQRKLDLTFNCNPKFMQDFERYPAFYDTILLAVPESDPINEKTGSFSLSAEDVVRGRHLDEDCPTVHLEEFREVSFVLLSEGNNLYDRSIQLFEEAGFEPKIKMVLSQLVTAYHLAESNFAATFVSDRLVRSGSGGLRFYKLDSDLIRRIFYILLPKRRYTSYATRQFIAYFLDFMKYENNMMEEMG